MNEHLLKLLTAYAAGTAATAFLVWVMWHLPIEQYLKHLLGWVLPVPAILIILVMLYYGPQSLPAGEEALPYCFSDFARVFLLGTLSAFGVYAFVPVGRQLYRRFTERQFKNESKWGK